LDAAKAIEVMTRLSDMGSYLAVDDFGTGYTSLAYLKSMPVHTIKIDRSFVMNMLHGGSDAFVVRSVIDLAHNMSKTVVAEGVENIEILKALAMWSCDTAQGYYFAKPLRAEDFEQWLKNYNANQFKI
ncbi:MAG: EAL domain-containing protein, partial [Gammaproteobacteria bacterium]|nr:EAL domain-containing protein [Gammaproteobacteria bacterium]